MEQFRDDQRYSLEKAQKEAQDLKLILELGEYGCRTYDEAAFYLPDFYLEQALLDGTAPDANEIPIRDSEWGIWGEIDMLPDSIVGEQDESDDLRYETACDEEDRDLYCPIYPADQQ